MTDNSSPVAKLVADRCKRRRRVWPWLLLAVLIGGGAAAWAVIRPETGAAAVRYSTERVTRGDLIVTVTATGTVQPTTQVTVSSELSGTLSTVDVDYNDAVEVGQVLATLDAVKLHAQVSNAEAQLAIARGQLEQAEATAREAAANFERQTAIDQRGIGASSALITVLAAHERAQAALIVSRANLQLAEANLGADRADLAKTTIRSPIRGVVLDRAAEPGQIVASSLNTPTLFTIAEDLRRMKLLVDVDEADIGKVAVGNAAEFSVDAFANRSFPAEITQVRFAPETTNNVVTYKAQLSVDNADLALRPGMTATAVIRVTELRDVLLVPNAALRYAPPREAAQAPSRTATGGLAGLIMPRRGPGSGASQQGTPVPGRLWVLRGGQPVQIAVQTGESDGRYSAVTGGDLREGDLVITDQATGGATETPARPAAAGQRPAGQPDGDGASASQRPSGDRPAGERPAGPRPTGGSGAAP